MSHANLWPSPQPNPHGPEFIDAEKSLLLKIQVDHDDQLDRLGISEKAKEWLLDRQEHQREFEHEIRGGGPRPIRTIDSELYQTRVANYSNVFQGRNNIPAVLFNVLLEGKNGEYVECPTYVPLIDLFDNEARPQYPFDEDDVAVVSRMLAGLADAKDFGVLPHLNMSATGIRDPNITPKATAKPL